MLLVSAKTPSSRLFRIFKLFLLLCPPAGIVGTKPGCCFRIRLYSRRVPIMDRGGFSSGSCYYSVLGIRKDASSSDIRTAYHKLAMRWHPDKWTRNPTGVGEANRRFQKIQEAYSVLSDEEKRSMYDAGFLDLLEQDEGMGDFLHDLINMMDKNVGAAEESLEDLQRTFVEMFGGDLAKMMEKDDPTTKKRSRESGSNQRAAPKRTNSTGSSYVA